MRTYLQFDRDDHGGQVLVQLLQHDQLLQSQVEEPGDRNTHTQLAFRWRREGSFENVRMVATFDLPFNSTFESDESGGEDRTLCQSTQAKGGRTHTRLFL